MKTRVTIAVVLLALAGYIVSITYAGLGPAPGGVTTETDPVWAASSNTVLSAGADKVTTGTVADVTGLTNSAGDNINVSGEILSNVVLRIFSLRTANNNTFLNLTTAGTTLLRQGDGDVFASFNTAANEGPYASADRLPVTITNYVSGTWSWDNTVPNATLISRSGITTGPINASPIQSSSSKITLGGTMTLSDGSGTNANPTTFANTAGTAPAVNIKRTNGTTRISVKVPVRVIIDNGEYVRLRLMEETSPTDTRIADDFELSANGAAGLIVTNIITLEGFIRPNRKWFTTNLGSTAEVLTRDTGFWKTEL